MEIILKKDVDKLGFSNEIVTVKNGYGRNFLIPKGLGILATTSAKRILTENLKQQARKEESEISVANKISENLQKLNIIIKVKVAEGGTKLFGSVKTSQFTNATSELGVEINSKFVKLPKIKELGTYDAEIRLHRKINVTIPFKVIAS